MGIERLEAVLFSLEPSGPSMGLVEKQNLSRKGKEKAIVEDCSWPNGLKPKK